MPNKTAAPPKRRPKPAERTEGFASWAVVELFGHQRIAGRVTEATIGGCAFVRVDVPVTEKREAYTKYFSNGAIYALTPCDAEVGRLAAEDIERYTVPVAVSLTPAMRERLLPRGTPPRFGAEDDIEDSTAEAEDDGLPY